MEVLDGDQQVRWALRCIIQAGAREDGAGTNVYEERITLWRAATGAERAEHG